MSVEDCAVEDWTVEVSEGVVPKISSNKSVTNLAPNYLFVRDFSQPSEPINRDIIGFSNHQKLGSFRIEDNQRYNDSNCDQNVIKDTIDFDLISKMNINLMEGFEESSLILDYKSYKLLKWQYFLKWIRKSECLENRSSESLPHFISFGGLFTSLMSTPNRIESWSLLVTKFKDSIFMNKIRLNSFNEKSVQSSDGQQMKSNGFVDKNPYFAAKLTQIITQSTEERAKTVVNEYEKCFSCYETQFGEHRLLLMSEMDAIDEEGNQYEIKCSKNLNFGKKLFNWWSHCVIADIDYILIGLKEDNGLLKSVHKLKVEELPQMSSFEWNTEHSFDFVNRLLNYIRQLLESASDLDMFKVWYHKNHKCIRSVKLQTNKLIPEWFTSGVESDQTVDTQIWN